MKLPAAFDWRGPWAAAGVTLLFALAWLLSTGYGFGLEDSANYIPLAWERLHPGLYRGDEAFQLIFNSSWNHHTSFFTSVLAGLGRLFTLEGAYFGVHLLTLWGLAWAWWRLGTAIGGPVVGYLGLVALAVSQPIAGTQMLTVPKELVPRSLASTAAFLALAALAEGLKTTRAAAWGALAVLAHPISGLMAAPAIALTPLMREGGWRARLRVWLVALGVLVLPYLGWHLLAAHGPVAEIGLFSRVSASWQQLIDYRLQGQAVNVAGWTPGQWLLVGVPVLLWLQALQKREPGQPVDRVLGTALMASIALAAIGSMGADVFRLSLFTQMMLSRLVFVPQVLGTLYGVWWLHRRFEAGGPLVRLWVLVAFAALVLGAMPALLLALVPILLLDRLVHDAWSRAGARVFSLIWLGLGLAVATRDRWLPDTPEVAPPQWLVFAHPPLLNLFVLAGLALAVLVLAHLARPLRAGLLMLAVAIAPLGVYAATHRMTPVSRLPAALAAQVQAPWHPANTPWREVAYWARRSTPEGARFLVPTLIPGFRAMAQRPIVTDWKDGGLALYSQARGERWLELFDAAGPYHVQPPAKLRALAARFDCAYVVLPAHIPYDMPAAYRNQAFAVYATGTSARR